MREKPESVPYHVALAIARVYGPCVELESYIRCRGMNRGVWEYQRDYPRRGAEMLRAYELVSQAMTIAAGNNWDWEDVCALAREQLRLSPEWRTTDDQRLIDCERAAAARLEVRIIADEQRQAKRMAEYEELRAMERAKAEALACAAREKAEEVRRLERDRERREESEYVESLAARLRRILTPTGIEQFRAARTKKSRARIVSELMVMALDTRNERATRAALDSVLDITVYIAD